MYDINNFNNNDEDLEKFRREFLNNTESATEESPNSTAEAFQNADKSDNQSDSVPEIQNAESEDKYYWHVVAISKNRDASLQRSFLELAKIPPYGIKRVYVPTEKVRKWKKNKQIEEDRSVMGYVFVQAKPGYLENRDCQLQIQTKYTVIGKVSDEEIKKMEEDFSNTPIVNEFQFTVGSKVSILKGNYVGLDGQIQSITEDGFITLRIWLMQGCEPTDIAVQIEDIGPVSEK